MLLEVPFLQLHVLDLRDDLRNEENLVEHFRFFAAREVDIVLQTLVLDLYLLSLGLRGFQEGQVADGLLH